MTALYIVGDVFDRLAELRRRRVQVALIMTSPPFLALRVYLPDGHPLKAQEIGSEATPAAFVDVMLALVAACAHVLAPWGSVALELGDTYAGSGGAGGDYDPDGPRAGQQRFRQQPPNRAERYNPDGTVRTTAAARAIEPKNNAQTLPLNAGRGWPLPKSLAGIPEAVMLSLAYGYNVLDRRGPDSPAGRWRVRNFKPWIRCLDIDTAVYVRTPTGDRPMRLLHLDQQFAPGKFELWTGDRWTPVVGTQQSRTADALEIEFRTGERVACTRDHRWPVESILGTTKLLRADELTVGDVVPQVRLPEPDRPEPPGLPDDDIGWLCGVYLGDGSFDSKGRIQIAGHRILDAERGERLQRIAADYDGTSSVYEHGNEDGGYRGNVVLRSTALAGVIRQYIGGKNARSKHLLPAAWRRSDAFLCALLDGYLASDGHYDEHNDRWRLGFTDNPWLARDLRTVAARLGVSCILKRFRYGTDPRGGNWAGSATHRYRGEIRFVHRTWTPAQRGEVVAIRSTKRSTFIDVAVADDPHLFALASGLLTHNSNPPVGALGDKERPATSYVIVATRDPQRYFDLDAVRTAAQPQPQRSTNGPKSKVNRSPSVGWDGGLEVRTDSHPAGAPPRDWCHSVDMVLDAELDRMAGKTGGEVKPGSVLPAGRLGAGDGTQNNGQGRATQGALTVGARGVHLRRALERAGILTTLDAIDQSPKGYRGAHYAVWPPELVRLLVDEMCPRRVCSVCGQPSRRITVDRSAFERQPELAAHIRERREALGVTPAEVNGWFGYKEIAKNWERTDRHGAAIPNAADWPVLAERLGLDRERFDDLVLGERRWVESTATYTGQDGRRAERVDRVGGDLQGSGSHGKRDGGKTAHHKTLGWSDCGCPGGADRWQPGIVLDPFVGSGTTLAVCSGMGRTSIGIDLDYTNVELAMDRVGMFLEVEWPEPDLVLLTTRALGPGSPHPADYDRWRHQLDSARAEVVGWLLDHAVAALALTIGAPLDDVEPQVPPARPRANGRQPTTVAGQGDLFTLT